MKRLIKYLPTAITLIIVMTLMIGVFFWFKGDIDQMVEDNNYTYLQENTSSQSVTFYTKLDDQLVMLESQERYFENIDMTNFEEMKNTIMAVKGIGVFDTIGVADCNGQSVNCDGSTLGSISSMDYFIDAMRGESAISKITYFDSMGQEILVLAVPIMQNEKAVGIVYGTFTKEVLGSLVDSMSFSGNSVNLLLSSDGNIIARSSNSQKLVTNHIVNFYDLGTSWGEHGNMTLDDIKGELINGKTAIIPYTSGINHRIIILKPVGIHDWYYATIIPQEIIKQQSKSITNHMLGIELALVVAFILLLIPILMLVRNNQMMSKNNERYQLITTQSQVIVFEYNIQKKQLEMNGNLECLLGQEAKGNVQGEKIEALAALIHEDDNALLEELRNLESSTKTSLQAEFRAYCIDGQYYWFRMMASIVRAENGTPLKLVGNLMNVEEQMDKERQLRQKAETDPLTGILNKGAFQAHVETALKNVEDSSLFALYIIDLDNFKKINDTLGHSIGDRVLSDVAQKLCRVFSDNDCVGRIGGDEFASFLQLSQGAKDIGMQIVGSKAKAICAQLQETYTDGESNVVVSASVGIALYPQDAADYASLFKKADAALYKSKNGGKNQFYFYKENM